MTPATCSWPAPAKVNLFLHVVGRRPDGYHNLQTAMQFLDWCDTLHFRIRSDGLLRRVRGPAWLPPEQDLSLRAAASLQAFAGTRLGADIALWKSLPAGGGLGGGSSDAATVLIALNQLWGTGLPRAELARLGASLGADVPLFVLGRAALAEGVGERLTPMPLPAPWYLVVNPGCAVNTAQVFGHPKLTRDSPLQTMPQLLAGPGRNDCLDVTRTLFPEVGRALVWLEAQAPARLSGTGGCVYATFPTRAAALGVRARVPDRWRARVARGLNEHPLLGGCGPGPAAT